MLGAIAAGLAIGGAVLSAKGEYDKAHAEKKALEAESKVAGINAESAKAFAEYELGAWEKVADENEHLRQLQVAQAEMTLNKDAISAEQIAQYRTQFALETITAESKLAAMLNEARRSEELYQLDETAMVTGIKAGLARGKMRASLATRGVVLDDGSPAEVLDSMDFAKDVDYAALMGKARQIEQTYAQETAKNQQQTNKRLGEVNLDIRTRTMAQKHELATKKEELTFTRDLENFLARRQLKDAALRRAWGYKTQSINQKIKQKTNYDAAKSIDPGLNAFASLLNGGARAAGMAR